MTGELSKIGAAELAHLARPYCRRDAAARLPGLTREKGRAGRALSDAPTRRPRTLSLYA